MMPFYFVLPRSFKPLDLLAGSLEMRADDARWLIDTVVRKTAYRDTDPWGYVRLHSRILDRTMDKHTRGDIVGALKRGEVIETAPHYVGVRTTGYRLNQRYLRDRPVRIPAYDPRLLKRIERERTRQSGERSDLWQPIHHKLDAEQRYVTITGEADGIVSSLKEHTRLCQGVLIDKIRRRDHPFSVSTTGRCFNSITGLKRELRAALRLGGERLGSVDIRCAQPALLALGLHNHKELAHLRQNSQGRRARNDEHGTGDLLFPQVEWLTRGGLPAFGPDVDCFCSAAVDGSLYEELVALSGLDRDTVKRRFLVDVLAKRGGYQSDFEDVFRESFPTVHRIVRAINHEDHGELIRLLQRLEAWLVIEQVCPRLLGRVPVVTLHDAVFCRRRDIEIVDAAFSETFDQLGFCLSLKPELWGEDSSNEANAERPADTACLAESLPPFRQPAVT